MALCPMNRKLLRRLVYVIALIGLVMASVPFVYSLSPGEKAKNDAWVKCDISDLLEGEIKQCGYANVYRRTEQDKQLVSKYVSLLEDPGYINSDQPLDSENKWRSSNKDYFVYLPWAPIRTCQVQLMERGSFKGWEPPEIEAINNTPYYFERCEGRAWDLSGRLYRREGFPPEKNLIVPKVKWASKSLMFIYRGK